ncbi:hypothetical protein HP15_p187g154 (plasmid) [Marinobacter adhaerens HP15]|jgi:hypothetical protein|uniref:Uncharacterized protein n=1 Tax=Marinobacter adhaerens (strain DSM 23420 / HP15) TaxID=225937 RepID=E4PSB6_MARAH|nr:hypothetical protein HP15_p187g154 [Marinobacter adhaerens HP15]
MAKALIETSGEFIQEMTLAKQKAVPRGKWPDVLKVLIDLFCTKHRV